MLKAKLFCSSSGYSDAWMGTEHSDTPTSTAKANGHGNAIAFFDAFLKYRWNCQTFEQNQVQLDILQNELRQSYRARLPDGVATACLGILKWGGVHQTNGKKVRNYANNILGVLDRDAKLLSEPSPTDEGLQMLNEFNVGWAKIYSLLLDNFIIYDSRVGAALGALVRDWCVSCSRGSVPEPLKFQYAPARTTKEPKIRNPSRSTLQFSIFSTHKSAHALCAIRASCQGLRFSGEIAPPPCVMNLGDMNRSRNPSRTGRLIALPLMDFNLSLSNPFIATCSMF